MFFIYHQLVIFYLIYHTNLHYLLECQCRFKVNVNVNWNVNVNVNWNVNVNVKWNLNWNVEVVLIGVLHFLRIFLLKQLNKDQDGS